MYEMYEKTKPLYLETGSSGVGLGAGLLQTRSGINCPRDKAEVNIILRPMKFVSKCLSNTEKDTAT